MVTPTAEEQHKDAFDDFIVKNTQNNLDLASQYTFSPERWRLYRNGSRSFPQYNTVSQFSDEASYYALQPDAGDTMTVISAERITYVVNYVLQSSQSLQLNQSLQDGDVLRFGPRTRPDTSADGWFMEQRGADHTDTEVDIKRIQNGSETTLRQDVELARPTTGWHRYETQYNWYNVGNQRWIQTFTDNGDQIQDQVAKTSSDGVRDTDTGNVQVFYQITASGSTTGLELQVGSAGLISLGDPVALQRDKSQFESITLSGTNDAWEPIYAVRIDPTDSVVKGQLRKLDALNYGGNADLEMVAVVFDSGKTNASSWSEPSYQNAQNTALQTTTDVSQVADQSGSVKDFGTSDKFGGYTIASAIVLGGGNTEGTSQTINNNAFEKKSLNAGDHLVLLARSSSTGSAIDFVWNVTQNW